MTIEILVPDLPESVADARLRRGIKSRVTWLLAMK